MSLAFFPRQSGTLYGRSGIPMVKVQSRRHLPTLSLRFVGTLFLADWEGNYFDWHSWYCSTLKQKEPPSLTPLLRFFESFLPDVLLSFPQTLSKLEGVGARENFLMAREHIVLCKAAKQTDYQ